MNFWLSALIHKRAVAHGPLVLVYHSVTSGARRPAWPWSISARDFAHHLDFIADRGYTTCAVRDLLSTTENLAATPRVVITFDDGYRDNLEAAEALSLRGMTASWFVLSGNLGQTPRWKDHEGPQDPLLDIAELRALEASGFEIGSHGVDHLRMTALNDAALDYQMNTSRQSLEQALGNPVRSFAYPFGAWDARVRDAADAAGYGHACTTVSGWALRDGDPLRIRRLTIKNTDSAAVLARKLAWAQNEVSWPHVAGSLARRLGGGLVRRLPMRS